MIKWPEPANQSLAEDIAALDCRYRGSPSYEHDAAYMRKAAENLVLKGYSIYTESQLKQAVRDALEEAAKVVAPKTPRPCACESCDCGNQDDAQRVAEWDAENAAASAIRALIKEIP